MKSPPFLEGLPWPEGDPGGLRSAGGEAAAVAAELDAQRAQLTGLADPLGWQGWAESSFAASVAAHGLNLSSAANHFANAAQVLIHLSEVLERAQETITKAAVKLHDAREAARNATAAAAAAHGPHALGVHAAAQRAVDEEQRVSRWAHGVANGALNEVQTADKAAAGVLHAAAAVAVGPGGMPVAPGQAGAPASPLAALGSYLQAVSHGQSPSHARWLGRPALPLPLGREAHVGARASNPAEQWAQAGLTALALDGLREGIGRRTELLTDAQRVAMARRLGVPLDEVPTQRLISTDVLPKWLQSAADSPALRSGLRYGLPAFGFGLGGVLDYGQARAEGHSPAGSARRATVNAVSGAGGAWAGRGLCGMATAATSETGGWGAATCPILIPAGAWAGHQIGEHIINPAIDEAGHLLHGLEHHFQDHPKPTLWDGPAKPPTPQPAAGGAFA